jgi:hypothetical protein
MLRLEPTDPAVRERTAAAVRASNEQNIRPALQVRCQKCRVLLARVGDVHGHGPLFTASWVVAGDDGHKVIVNGVELRDRDRAKWIAEHYETGAESGRPMYAPLHHIVIALLAQPSSFAQDYPDLLTRCPRHGDYVADRLAVLKALRVGDDVLMVMPSGGTLEYETPTGEHLRTKSTARQAVLRLKADVMTVAEFESKRAGRTRRHAERSGEPG